MAGIMSYQQRLSGVKSSRPVDPILASHGGIPKRTREGTVTCPSDEKTFQVRLYDSLSENLPVEQSHVWKSFQSHRCSINQHDSAMGLEVTAKRARINKPPIMSLAAERHWCYPPKVLLESAWLVAEGDESMESSWQPERERKVLEAIYRSVSSIPYSPIEPEVNCHNVDDALIPQIPIIAVEDEDECDQNIEVGGCPFENSCAKDCPKLGSNEGMAKQNLASHNEIQTTDCGSDKMKSAADPQIAAAAAALCMAVKAVGGSNLVDEELLVKILRNPVLLKSLTIGRENPEKPARELLLGFVNNSLFNESNSDSQNIAPSVRLAVVGGEKNGATSITSVGKSVVSSSHTAIESSAQLSGAQAHLLAAARTPLAPAANAAAIFRRPTLADSSHRLAYENFALPDARKAIMSSFLPANLLSKSHALPSSSQHSGQYAQQGARASILSNAPSLLVWKNS